MQQKSSFAAVQLPPNFVWRSYLGGRELRRFRQVTPGQDDHFPEDWLASTTRARNGENAQGPDEGLSRVPTETGETSLRDLLRRHPETYWGTRAASMKDPGDSGVLVKLLDSSTRLHIQAHPDRRFVEQHFGGSAGKTECWYILDTRDDAYVYLGFQRAPSRVEWEKIIEKQDLDAMLGCFDRIPVRPGDCFVVPAGTPHAIGEGILMIELQEPTDWVVRCEFEVGGHVLPHAARYMGLELEDVLDLFDYTAYSPEAVRDTFYQSPRERVAGEGHVEEDIIAPQYQDFFRLRRLRGHGAAEWLGGEMSILIAVKGEGTLSDGNGTQGVRAGETWLLPASTPSWHWRKPSKDWELLLAQPPLPGP